MKKMITNIQTFSLFNKKIFEFIEKKAKKNGLKCYFLIEKSRKSS